MTCIFAIFAASWDLLAGYTGQVNFGHALFFGAGAYTSALLSLRPRHHAVGDDLGGRRGGDALRLPGRVPLPAAARLVSLACDARVSRSSRWACSSHSPDFSGGELGISRPAAPYGHADRQLLRRGGLDARHRVRALGAGRLEFGIVLHAIRDDEVAARASGINTLRYKLAVFALSAAAAGFAGALFAHYLRVAGPSTWRWRSPSRR